MATISEGEVVQVKGSAAKPYEMKNVGGVLSCTCIAWRMQSLSIEKRTCKHLKAYLGAAAEAARIGGPSVTQVGTNTARISSSSPNASTPPRPGTIVTGGMVTSEEAQAIVDRAAAEGRKLRQDEKTRIKGPGLLLAHPWDPDTDPTGWLWSEKLDGCRGLWTGKEFISRGGNKFHAPAWFCEGLPDHPLDGELYMGRQSFQPTMSIVRSMDAGNKWRQIRFMVFDMPESKDPFEGRLEELEDWHQRSAAPFAKILPHGRVTGKEHLLTLLREHVDGGGEGLMIRKPNSLYEAGRSHSLLKVKDFRDMEGRVVAHEPGKGRHKGRLGALELELPNGIRFSLGTGFSDDERRNPPPVGSMVTFTYTELTEAGKPKCTGFLRARPEE